MRYLIEFNNNIKQFSGTENELNNYIDSNIPFGEDFNIIPIKTKLNIQPTHYIEVWNDDLGGISTNGTIAFGKDELFRRISMTQERPLLKTVAIFNIQFKPKQNAL